MTAKHPNSVPPRIVYPPGPIERQANTVPWGMLFGGGGFKRWHPQLASTLAAARAAVMPDFAAAQHVAAHDEGSIDAALDKDLDTLLPLSERKWHGVLRSHAPTLQ